MFSAAEETGTDQYHRQQWSEPDHRVRVALLMATATHFSSSPEHRADETKNADTTAAAGRPDALRQVRQSMRTSPPPNHSYRCPNGCDTYIDAASANRILIRQIMQDAVSNETAAELQEPVESQLAEHVRQEMPGVKPPAVSAECVLRYATDPQTYQVTSDTTLPSASGRPKKSAVRTPSHHIVR
ncbi:MAG: hypothetical protein OXF79_04745 [Chloroflexi bacterium]|nr:hypothetical protein [Chloroflexota bacterium]